MTTEASSTGRETQFITHASGSDIGMRREENQDNFGIVSGDEYQIFVVADGMGGMKGGAEASRLAIETFEEMLQQNTDLSTTVLVDAVEHANSVVFKKGSGDPEYSGMGTTFVALAFQKEKMLVVNVGDSRAYRIRNGTVRQITHDHTLVKELVRSGAISEDQAENHPVSHMLTRSLGPAAELEVDCWEYEYGPARGDRYLLCSDGLYNLVSKDDILEILTECSGEEAVQSLIALANERGGNDNITAILIEIGEDFPKTVDDYVDEAEELTEPPTLELEEEMVKGVTGGMKTNGSGASDSDSPELTEGVSLEDLQDYSAEIEDSINRRRELDDEMSRRETEAIHLGEGKTLKERFLDPRFTLIVAVVAALTVGYAGGILNTVGNKSEDRSPEPAVVQQEQPEPPPVEDRTAVDETVADQTGSTGSVSSTSETSSEQPASFEQEIDAQQTEVQDSAQGSEQERGIGDDFVDEPGRQPEVAAREQAPAPDDVYFGGLTLAEARNLSKRKRMLRKDINALDEQILAFDQPLSGESGAVLQNARSKKDELGIQLEDVKASMDNATRTLQRWVGMKKRLESVDALNLASEVSELSENVRKSKEEFERATWRYLQEAERLKYNTGDLELEKRVAELARERKSYMIKVSDQVRRAIEAGEASSYQSLSELALKREQLESDLESVEDEIEFVRVLISSDPGAREDMRSNLVRKRDVMASELDELERLIPAQKELE